MSDHSLFNQFAEMTTIRRPIAMHPGQEVEYVNPQTGKIQTRTAPISGTSPIRFEIHSITANQSLQAESYITAQPPAMKREEASPSGMGTVEVQVGYDYEHPEYLRQVQAQRPLRDAAVCLFGCPTLRESTPGGDIGDKIKKLVETLPAGLLEWISDKINTLAALTAVGEEEVAAFFSNGSVSSPSSPNSTERSRTSGSGKSSSGKTGPTSPTKSGKPRGSTD